MIRSTKLVRLYAGQAESNDGIRFITNFNTGQLNNVSGISLKTCCFQNSHPNIFAPDQYGSDPNNNNVFRYTIGVTEYSVTIDKSGYYDIDQILAIINPQLQIDMTAENPGDTAVLAIDDITGKLVLTLTGVVSNPVTLNGTTLGSLNGTIGNMFDYLCPVAGDYPLSNIPSLSGLKFATISVKTKSPQTILNANPIKERHTNSIGVIPVTAPFLGMQTFTDPAPVDSMLTFNPPEQLRRVQFVLRDELGRGITGQDLNLAVEMVVITSQ
jgi:hypothetical protein